MQPTAWFMIHVTCRLTAKNRDQLRNPTLGNRVWATFYQFITHSSITHIFFQTCQHIMSIAQTLTLLNLTDVICLCCSLHDCLFLRLSSTQCGNTGPCVVTNPLRTRGHSPRFYTFAPGRPQAGARGARAKNLTQKLCTFYSSLFAIS